MGQALDQAEFDLMMRVNVEGMFWVSQAAIPHLLETGGNIVNVASASGIGITGRRVAGIAPVKPGSAASGRR